MVQLPKPIVLAVLDGWGESSEKEGNAIAQANLPTIEELNKHHPKVLLQASGMSVGLPWGVMGNSEVGHQSLGSGQIIYQFNPLITTSIESGDFFKNETLLQVSELVKSKGSALHLMGLVSDGGVHSHIDHLMALLEFAAEQKIEKIFLHFIADGRDSEPKSAKKFLDQLLAKMERLRIGKIASITGRYFTMDRNNNWDRIEKGFLAMVEGRGILENDPKIALENQYQKGVTDEYLEPIVISDADGKPVGKFSENDVLLFFNFRNDRARQIASVFLDDKFDKFSRSSLPKNFNFVSFVKYEKNFGGMIVFPPQEITTRLGEILSQNGLSQLRIAETEKYAHVTYFFNGGVEKPFPNEDRELIPSKNAPSYADVPEMSAAEITEKLLSAIESKKYDFILVNYANADMVGHTGNLKATIKAVECIDQQLKKVIEKVTASGGALIITADHGNAEDVINLRTGERDTEHSSNPVPCWLVTPDNKSSAIRTENQRTTIDGMLVDVAPTILELLQIDPPSDMLGQSLVGFLK